MIRPFLSRTLLLGITVLLSAQPWPCPAHTTGLSTGELNLGTNGLDAQLTFATADMIAALNHLDETKPVDANRDGKITPSELNVDLGRFQILLSNALVVEFDGRSAGGAAPLLSADDKDNFHLQMTFAGERPGRLRVRANLFDHLPENHSQFLAVRDLDGQPLGSRMLTAGDDTLELDLPTSHAPAEQQKPRIGAFGGFFMLGVQHICTGYDHLLFLLALLLVCANFKSAVQVVTFFTIAHSITLALATLNLVRISGRIVEPAVAASIVYVAVENLVKTGSPTGRWRITFLFGLIHGIGFASVLHNLGVAASTTGLVVPLVAFNLGVEFGQIVIVVLILPVIWRLRTYDLFLRRGVPACSAVVALLGGIWLIQRLFS